MLALASQAHAADAPSSFGAAFKDICLQHTHKGPLLEAFRTAGWTKTKPSSNRVFRQSFVSAMKNGAYIAPGNAKPSVYGAVVSGNGSLGRTDTVCMVRYYTDDVPAAQTATRAAFGKAPLRSKTRSKKITETYTASASQRSGFTAEQHSNGVWLVTAFRHAAER